MEGRNRLEGADGPAGFREDGLQQGKIKDVVVQATVFRVAGGAGGEFRGGAGLGVAGEIMPVEVAVLEGKGGLQMTGQMGEVMQESGQAALTYIKSRAPQLNIDFEVFERMDIHVHMPEGGIPKDGPSAGITMATAIVSALTGRPVYRHVGMTGEITLRGEVLPIGGLKEKLLAAHRGNIKTVLIPEENRKDLADIPKNVLDDLNIRPVRWIDEVLEAALERMPEPVEPTKSTEGEGGGSEKDSGVVNPLTTH